MTIHIIYIYIHRLHVVVPGSLSWRFQTLVGKAILSWAKRKTKVSLIRCQANGKSKVPGLRSKAHVTFSPA